jgi:NTP pyrophosphatase (non-canonical NTP hydrolase)
MNVREYHNLAIRTINPAHTPLQNLNNAALGLCGEFAEVQACDSVQSSLLKELGDMLWYCVQACVAIGVNLDDVFITRSLDLYYDEESTITGIGMIADITKKAVFHEHPLTHENIEGIALCINQIVTWINLVACLSMLSLEQVMEANIAKLRKRYPAGFSAEASLNRSDND